jgi:excisionase family DNA binding protein
MENLIGPEEASRALGIELATVYTWVTRRKIPFIKVNGALRFRPSTLQEWLRLREYAPKASEELHT